MPSHPSIDIITGSDLPDAIIERMNQQRIHEYGENTKNFRKNEQASIFFFLREEGVLRAFGMLKPLTLTYGDTSTDILGIGNIIAIDKGKGYGKTLMAEIRDYLTRADRIGLGFCAPENGDFYEKCGYRVVEGLTPRFRYRYAHQDGNSERQTRLLHVLCYDPQQMFLDTVLASDDLIYSNVPFW